MPYLLVAPTLAEAARMARIGRTTLYRWMQDPVFRMDLERLRSEASSLAKEELQGLAPRAVHVLAELMAHPDGKVRLRSAHVALSVGLKANDPKEISEKIDHLDDAPYLSAKRRPIMRALRAIPYNLGALTNRLGGTRWARPKKRQMRAG